MISVGVIGVGYWGPNLVRNFSKIESCGTLAVADIKQERLTLLKSQYPEIKTYLDPHEVMCNPEIDAIVIATPLSSHYELAKEALNNGKHVLVEKPLTETSQQALDLIKLSQEKGKVLMVDHTYVYHNAVRKIKEIIDSGEVGDIYFMDSIRAHWDFGIFRHEKNVIWDLAPHDLSIMNFLIPREPVSLTAAGICCEKYAGNKSVENIAYVTINIADNILAHFHFSWVSPLKIRRIIIGGSQKLVIFDQSDIKSPIKVYDKRIKIENIEDAYRSLLNQEQIGDMYTPEVLQTEPLDMECRHFIDCIERKKRVTTDAKEGFKVVRLLEASQKSLEDNGRKVFIE